MALSAFFPLGALVVTLVSLWLMRRMARALEDVAGSLRAGGGVRHTSDEL